MIFLTDCILVCDLNAAIEILLRSLLYGKDQKIYEGVIWNKQTQRQYEPHS